MWHDCGGRKCCVTVVTWRFLTIPPCIPRDLLNNYAFWDDDLFSVNINEPDVEYEKRECNKGDLLLWSPGNILLLRDGCRKWKVKNLSPGHKVHEKCKFIFKTHFLMPYSKAVLVNFFVEFKRGRESQSRYYVFLSTEIKTGRCDFLKTYKKFLYL